VILPVGRLGDFREGCASLRFISSRTFSALLPERVPLALVAFVDFFGVAAFLAFAVFLAFAFFRFAVSDLVVVSCVLIVFSFLSSASDDTFITPVSNEGEAKERENGPIQKGLDASVGNEVTAHADVINQTDSNGSLIFSVQFSGMPVLRPLDTRPARTGGSRRCLLVVRRKYCSVGQCSVERRTIHQMPTKDDGSDVVNVTNVE
jgi:hypothetical protein